MHLVDRPDEVVADQALCDLLATLLVRLEGRLAIVSGRSLAQIDDILGEVAQRLALSGSHGCEHRWGDLLAQPARPESLDRAAERLRLFIGPREGVLLEEKSFGVAVHYRLDRTVEEEAQAFATQLAEELDLEVQHGKLMVELRVAGGDKGRAVHRMMSRPPMAGTRPLFIGDDVTDEAGFVAARELGGDGILIGPPRESAASFSLASPDELRRWLGEACR